MHDYKRFLQEFEEIRMRALHLFEERVHTEVCDASTSSGEWTPAVDVVEAGDLFVLTAEIAGVRREDVSIEVKGNVLSLKGTRLPGRNGAEAEGYRRMEIPFGGFERSFTLPSAVAAEGIEARLHDGLLTVTLPRREAPGRSIAVEAV